MIDLGGFGRELLALLAIILWLLYSVCLFLRCWGLGVGLVMSVPEFSYLLGISCKLSPKEITCMKCHILFYAKKRKKYYQYVVC